MSKWEARMVRQGVERYRSTINSIRGKAETLDPVVSHILTTALPTMIGAVEESLANRSPLGGPVPDVHLAWHMLHGTVELIQADRVGLIAARTIMDSLSKKTIASSMARRVGKRLQEECLMQQMKDHDPAWFKLHQHRFHCATHIPPKRVRIARATSMASWLKLTGDKLALRYWTDRELTAVGTYLIEIFKASTGLIDVVRIRARGGHRIAHVLPSAEAGKWVNDWRSSFELTRPYFRALLDPPQDWTTATSGGFITEELRQDLIKSASDEQVEAVRGASMQPVYDGVNKLQRTGYRINRPIFEIMSEWWATGTCEVLPSMEDLPMPEKGADWDSLSDSLKREYRQRVAEAHRMNNALRGKRLATTGMIAAARELADEERFFFVHQCDDRGRVYPFGASALTPQGTSESKALLEFDEGKPIETEEQARQFLIRGAALAGMDKESHRDAVNWVMENAEMISACADRPFENRQWMDVGDDCWLFLAWCMDFDRWKRDPGVPIHHICGFDATQSGMQILAMLARDPDSAAQVNCIPGDAPVDLYLTVLSMVQDDVREIAATGKGRDRGMAETWQKVEMDRKWVKGPVMTRQYNATKYSHTIGIAEKLEHESGMVLPVRYIYPTAKWMTDRIHIAADKVSGRSLELLDWLTRCARAVAKEGVPIRWTTPCGFPVIQKYTKTTIERINTLCNGVRVGRSYSGPTDELKVRQMGSAFAPNFIHSMDSTILYMVANRVGTGHFSAAHDCFGVHAADVPDLKKAIGSVYTELFSEDWLAKLHAELASQMQNPELLPPPFELGDLDTSLFAQSQYAYT